MVLLGQNCRKDLCSLRALVFTLGDVNVWTRQNNFAVTLHPVFYPHPPPCTAPELLDKLPLLQVSCWRSVTGLLLTFAKWVYLNYIWDAWKTATAGDTSCATSQSLAVLNCLQDVVWLCLLHTPTFSIHSPSVHLVGISHVRPCLSPCLMSGLSSGPDFPLWNCVWVNWPFSWDLEAEGKDRLQERFEQISVI